MNPKTTCKMIALVGGSGSGKTWLADHLSQEFGDAAMSLALDDFYADRSPVKPAEREKINFDHPDAIDWPLFEAVLRELRNGDAAMVPRYDFASHTRLADWKPVRARPFIFVEGLWLLWPPQLRALFDFRIFLDCVQLLRFQRRLARDLSERGRTAEAIYEQFRTVVEPMHGRFVEVQKEWADLVIEKSITRMELGRLCGIIRALPLGRSATLLPPTATQCAPPGFSGSVTL
jgi:uridine kinase